MNIRARMAEQTANLRAASEYPKEEVTASNQANDKPKTGPGMAAALAAANIKIQELEARGAQSMLPVSEIVPNPWQPRRIFNEAKLAELAESIREVGLLQPIVVRRAESAYQIVAGERRWRAHKKQTLRCPVLPALLSRCAHRFRAGGPRFLAAQISGR